LNQAYAPHFAAAGFVVLTFDYRGEIDPVPQGFTAFDLPGTPYVSRMADYAPVDLAGQLKIPLLVIVVEKEELMDNHTCLDKCRLMSAKISNYFENKLKKSLTPNKKLQFRR
jgi:hypothetical protein